MIGFKVFSRLFEDLAGDIAAIEEQINDIDQKKARFVVPLDKQRQTLNQRLIQLRKQQQHSNIRTQQQTSQQPPNIQSATTMNTGTE